MTIATTTNLPEGVSKKEDGYYFEGKKLELMDIVPMQCLALANNDYERYNLLDEIEEVCFPRPEAETYEDLIAALDRFEDTRIWLLKKGENAVYFDKNISTE